jgi:hypothetical protein
VLSFVKGCVQLSFEFFLKMICYPHDMLASPKKIGVHTSTPGMYMTWGDSVQWDRPVGPGGGRPAISLGRPASSWTCVYTRRERLWRWRKFMKDELIGRPTKWLGRPAITWWVTASVNSVELCHGPINTPQLAKVNTHATIWRSHLQSSLSLCTS